MFCYFNFLVRQIHKIVKGKALQTPFDHIFKRRKLFAPDNFSVYKGFKPVIHKINSRLNFVLIIFGCRISKLHIGKVCVIRTLVTLKLLTAILIYERFCRIQFGNRFLDLFQVVVCLPLALKLLADALIVDIDRFRQIVPNGITIIGFNDEKSLVGRERIFCRPVVCKIGRINDFYAFRLRIKAADKILRYSVPVFILIENDGKRNTVVIFFLYILFKLIGAGIFNAFPHRPVRMQIVNPADRLRLHRIFLIGRYDVSGAALSAFQRADRHIKATVKQHIDIGFQAVCRKAAHLCSLIAADRTGRKIQLQRFAYGLCVRTVGFKEIAHLIQNKAVGISTLDFAVRTISVRKAAALVLLNKPHKVVLALQTGLRILHRAIHQLHIPVIYPCDFKRLSVQIHSVADFISGRE